MKDHFTHIYSYNKVMSQADRIKICKILNKTNFCILAWYFNYKETAYCGLKYFKQLFHMPMQSTGSEKFTVYVYYKTKLYTPKDFDTSDEE